MKILKTVGLILAALVILLLVVGLIMPTEYSVSRSIVINKPRAEVYPLLSSLPSQEKWSPWAEYDPGMKVTFTGTPGTVGEKSVWEGNSDVGSGSQKIKALVPGEMVHNEVHFKEPFESVSQAYFNLVDEVGGTRVTWKIEGKNPYPWNAMSVFMDMDAMIGKDFDHGLNKLKKLSESQPAPVATR